MGVRKPQIVARLLHGTLGTLSSLNRLRDTGSLDAEVSRVSIAAPWGHENMNIGFGWGPRTSDSKSSLFYSMRPSV